MKLINSKEVSLEFKPWTDYKCRITRLQILEQLGGEIPNGEIDMILGDDDETEKLVTNQNTGIISIIDEKKYGLSYTIDVFITSRQYYNNILSIKFVCISNPEFFTKRITTTHQGGIKSTIESLYPGPKDIRIEPSGNDDTILYQNCETNYEMCKRLCYSYKNKSIFAFGWSGLLLKDLQGDFDSQGNVENPDPCLKLESDRLSVQTQTYNLKYNKHLNATSFSAWEDQENSTTGNTNFSNVISKNCKVIMNYKDYRVVGIKSGELLENAWNNTNIMTAGGYSSIKIVYTDIPHYMLGDVVLYDRALQERSLPWKNYLVFSNELFFSVDANKKVDERGLRFSWTSKLIGLEDGKWSKDPSA